MSKELSSRRIEIPNIYITQACRAEAKNLSAESIRVDKDSLQRIIAGLAINNVPSNLLLCKQWDKIDGEIFHLTDDPLDNLGALTGGAKERIEYAQTTIEDWKDGQKIRQFTARALLFGTESINKRANRTSPVGSFLGSLGVNTLEINARRIKKEDFYGVPFQIQTKS